MPKKNNQTVDQTIINLREYLGLDRKQAVKNLSKNRPIQEEKEDDTPVAYTQSAEINQSIHFLSFWGKKGASMFYDAANYTHKHVLNDSVLTEKRHRLATECLADLERVDPKLSPEAAIERIKQLIVDNMQESLAVKGEFKLDNGSLHKILCKTLNLSDAEAYQLTGVDISEHSEADDEGQQLKISS